MRVISDEEMAEIEAEAAADTEVAEIEAEDEEVVAKTDGKEGEETV
jgi:hypothetical protein